MADSIYKCVKCGKVFQAMHFSAYRMATGRTVTHCGTAAQWLRNVEEKRSDL